MLAAEAKKAVIASEDALLTPGRHAFLTSTSAATECVKDQKW